MQEKNQFGMFQDASIKLFQFAEENRKHPTPTETMLWEQLKNKQLKGYKFRRQHPIGAFILDFYCHAQRLGIEIDGAYHADSAQQEYDSMRDKSILLEANVKILRFTNDEVLRDIESVLNTIEKELAMR